MKNSQARQATQVETEGAKATLLQAPTRTADAQLSQGGQTAIRDRLAYGRSSLEALLCARNPVVIGAAQHFVQDELGRFSSCVVRL
jgi:hypothetical protein